MKQSEGNKYVTSDRGQENILSYCNATLNLALTPNFSPSVTTSTSALWKDEGNGILAMEFKCFSSEMEDTQVDVLHEDV